jgi:acyl-CoA reductase-like NAD-dependent aldehyde dehydrogenase
VNPSIRVISEEVFGPVLPVAPFDDEAQAIRQANHTPYGLTAELFTRDAAKATRVASQLLAGGVAVNMDFAFVPDCPVGGYKKSGLGREYGMEGFRELAQLKYLCVAK